MLRESSTKEGTPAHLRGLVDTSVDLAVHVGEHLRGLSTALVARDRPRLDNARSLIVAALGEEAAVTSIGVVANFQMMNRALDAVGIPAQSDPSIADELGVDPASFGGIHGSHGPA